MSDVSDPSPVLGANVTRLEGNGKTYYIVGTAHVSKESIQEVESTIDAIKPDTVCVELCNTRHQALTDNNRWKNLDIFKVIREGKMLLLLANLAVGAYQRRLGQELGVELIGCQMTMDVFGFELDEFIDGVNIGGAATFLGFAADADIQLFI